MAVIFLPFSFFKMLDLQAFADSYRMYDILAGKFPFWAKLYPFVELGLGIALLMNLLPVMINLVTLVVMLVSIVGVIQRVLNRKAIQCACLGGVFNLPMRMVTIVEDGWMILMSIVMLWMNM